MKKDDEQRLHVSYIPRLITKRKQKVISQYVERFYTPYIFVLWLLVAFDIDDCSHMKYIVPFLTLIASIHATIYKYDTYYKDLMYVMQTESIEVDWYTKMHYLTFEFIIQICCCFVNMYWVDEVHTCMFGLNRQYQSSLFITVIILTFVLHVGHYKQTKKQTEYFVRSSYNHLNNVDV